MNIDYNWLDSGNSVKVYNDAESIPGPSLVLFSTCANDAFRPSAVSRKSSSHVRITTGSQVFIRGSINRNPPHPVLLKSPRFDLNGYRETTISRSTLYGWPIICAKDRELSSIIYSSVLRFLRKDGYSASMDSLSPMLDIISTAIVL